MTPIKTEKLRETDSNEPRDTEPNPGDPGPALPEPREPQDPRTDERIPHGMNAPPAI